MVFKVIRTVDLLFRHVLTTSTKWSFTFSQLLEQSKVQKRWKIKSGGNFTDWGVLTWSGKPSRTRRSWCTINLWQYVFDYVKKHTWLELKHLGKRSWVQVQAEMQWAKNPCRIKLKWLTIKRNTFQMAYCSLMERSEQEDAKAHLVFLLKIKKWSLCVKLFLK